MAHGTFEAISSGALDDVPEGIPRWFGEDGDALRRAVATEPPQPPTP